MTTTYKGYEIDNCTGDRFIIRLNGVHMDTVKGSLACAHFCIDSNFEDMTPVDTYQGLDLDQAEGEPTAEELNQAEGVKYCSFMEAVEANTAGSKSTLPVKKEKLTQEQKEFYWNAYHEGYKQAQKELNHIVNP